MPRRRFVIRSGQEIKGLQDWMRLAPPQEEYQWAEGRSAMELARRWLEASPEFPSEIAALLGTRPEFVDVMPSEGIAEAETPPDDFSGYGRHHDLLVVCDRPGATAPIVVLGVEVKVDEPFDRILDVAMAEALRRSPNSKVPDRINLLADALFGGFVAEQHGTLHYQLLHAAVGAIIEAESRHASLAALIVHEFVTNESLPAKHELNAKALESFVRTLTPRADSTLLQLSVEPGILYGPFVVRKTPHVTGECPLFVGKAQARIGQASTRMPSPSDRRPRRPLRTHRG